MAICTECGVYYPGSKDGICATCKEKKKVALAVKVDTANKQKKSKKKYVEKNIVLIGGEKVEIKKFDKAKAEIKKFAKTTDEEIIIPGVKTSAGPFDLFDHIATGKDLNTVAKNVQAYLISFNERDRQIIQEFGKVYDAFDAIDKEYIHGIIVAVEAAKTASDQAKDAQKDNENTLAGLKQTVDALCNIDTDVRSNTTNIKVLRENIEHQISSINEKLYSIDNCIKTIESYDLENIEKETTSNIEQVLFLSNEVKRNASDISDLLEQMKDLCNYNSKLDNINHLWEMDNLWDMTEKEIVQSQGLSLQINELTNNLKNEINLLKTKLNIAYCIGGLGVGLAIVQFVLHVLGVL